MAYKSTEGCKFEGGEPWLKSNNYFKITKLNGLTPSGTIIVEPGINECKLSANSLYG